MRSKKTKQNSEYIPLDDIEQDNNEENEEIIENVNNDTVALIPKNSSATSTAVSDEYTTDNKKTGKIIPQEDEDAISQINNNTSGDIILSIPSTSTQNINDDTTCSNSHSSDTTNITNPSNNNNIHKKGLLSSKIAGVFQIFKNKNSQNRNKKINRPKVQAIDGVFSNLNEKPQIHSEALPTYYEVTGEEEVDPLGGYVVSLAQSGEYYGELVVDGLPLGSWAGMIFSAMISMAFDFLGFIMTFFLATSHATRKGSLIGLAVTILRYGLYINEQFDEAENHEKSDKGYDPEDDEFDYAGYKGLMDQWWFSRWFGYFLMLISVAIIARNIYTYLKIRKAINYAKNHSECIVDG